MNIGQGPLPGGGDERDSLFLQASALARTAHLEDRAWFWLEHTDEGRSTSWVGLATRSLHARGRLAHEVLAAMRRELGQAGAVAADPATFDAPAVFRAGWVVNFTYEFGVALSLCERECAGRCRVASDDLSVAHWVDDVSARAQDLVVADDDGGLRPNRSRFGTAPAAAPDSSPRRTSHVSPNWGLSEHEYLAAIRSCQESIANGDAYVLCLTDTARVPVQVDALSAYLALRSPGPVIRGGVITDEDRAWVSASPERFLSVRGRRASTSPIKGTRPRATDPVRDTALRDELAHDEKEHAENLMIVDLMRNDLSRVCEPATVDTRDFLQVRSLPRVHQLESTVTGTLARGYDALDLLEACFPGGSMTGAPKRRAIELLALLEAGPRGWYSGCSGWIDRSGDMNLGMNIRGACMLPGRALVGAGGGITVDSEPDRELEEQRYKARGVLDALGH